MKLIYCPKCQDVKRLWEHSITCKCGQSGGWYEKDGLHAKIWGSAIPLGIDNADFKLARIFWYDNGLRSEKFDAFIIEKNCKTIKKRG